MSDTSNLKYTNKSLRLVSMPCALADEQRIVHECFIRRQRHLAHLNDSPHQQVWQRFYNKTGRRRVRLMAFLKRCIDGFFALILLIVLSPVLLGLTLAVLYTSPGPVLYKSLRIGREGKPFYMLKFRSMVVDADQLRQQLRKSAEQNNQLFKLEKDPRMTPIGAFIRKYSLDELPQLINVLLGDMSMVGPRPFAPDDARLFQDPYTLRFEVMPGMTGLWQVSGRSHLNFRQLCKLDLTYALDWSLLNDLRILLKTIPVVFGKEGAF